MATKLESFLETVCCHKIVLIPNVILVMFPATKIYYNRNVKPRFSNSRDFVLSFGLLLGSVTMYCDLFALLIFSLVSVHIQSLSINHDI